jgi:hypothetical protein
MDPYNVGAGDFVLLAYVDDLNITRFICAVSYNPLTAWRFVTTFFMIDRDTRKKMERFICL